MEGQTAESVTDLMWSRGERRDAPDATLDDIVGRGLARCGRQ